MHGCVGALPELLPRDRRGSVLGVIAPAASAVDWPSFPGVLFRARDASSGADDLAGDSCAEPFRAVGKRATGGSAADADERGALPYVRFAPTAGGSECGGAGARAGSPELELKPVDGCGATVGAASVALNETDDTVLLGSHFAAVKERERAEGVGTAAGRAGCVSANVTCFTSASRSRF